MADELLTSQEWHDRVAAKYPKFLVMDPDGWDRKNYDVSWAEKITLEEFMERASRSTCCWPGDMFDEIITYGEIHV